MAAEVDEKLYCEELYSGTGKEKKEFGRLYVLTKNGEMANVIIQKKEEKDTLTCKDNKRPYISLDLNRKQSFELIQDILETVRKPNNIKLSLANNLKIDK